MLKLITSLSFLYALTIIVLMVYGWMYYRDFVRSALHRGRFPLIFSIIGLGCFAFLWINIHAPLRLQTFSNLDHHFIRHDGFVVNKKIELGRTDTINFDNNAFNSFRFAKKNNQVIVNSEYSEEPFYTSGDGKFQLRSAAWAALGHTIGFKWRSSVISIRTLANDSFELSTGEGIYKSGKDIKKGITGWNLFKDESLFINSPYYNDENLVNALKNVFILRDDVSKKEAGDLKYFISSRLFRWAEGLSYDQLKLRPGDLRFTSSIPDKTVFAWGLGFLDNNKNQYRLRDMTGDSFMIAYRYPVSYPLTEENNNDWSEHSVTKFLVPGSKDMLNLPAVFSEGFLFSVFARDSTMDFSPVLLSYQKAPENKPIELKLQWLNKPSAFFEVNQDKFSLPARSNDFRWQFSIQNTFDWEFGGWTMKAGLWQGLIAASLLLFFLLILFTSLITPPEKLSWVWQLLSCMSLLLIVTRFFLYWRYKSFPPYEGMDLPSQQQLNSFWNFGIIVFATVLLALVFGFGCLRYAWNLIRRKSSSFLKISSRRTGIPVLKKNIVGSFYRSWIIRTLGLRTVFFVSWIFLLAGAAGLAYINHFDPGACRHLAIGLMIIYFIYGFISYRYSPLVKDVNNSWWTINTSSKLDIMVSNPAKVLLSVSLLATFVFIDIGFAIVFLNFLLFNEAFLCINYAVAGLSAGSRKNASWFGMLGFGYLLAFILNLLYAPYIFQWLLDLPQSIYIVGYLFFSILVAYNLVRLFHTFQAAEKDYQRICYRIVPFCSRLFFFPKEKILNKAAMTKYRVAVLTMPVEKVIEQAYREGKTYEPVIRAAQNQWFINTLIYDKNNPDVSKPGFHLLPHAPQNKGAKYNAQATDLVASRFFLAEHGTWSVLLYVLLLLLPTSMLASFYKLYPDFSNRTNTGYPTITAGFSILNYFLISALLVILAATGRYIFFGQDMPFGSILSKQSILFPSGLILVTVVLFKTIPLEYYGNRRKFIPGIMLFAIVGILLFFVKPVFNNNKEFNAEGLAKDMDHFVQLRLQPLLDYFDTAAGTRRYPMAKKDRLFTDSVRRLIAVGGFETGNKFFEKEAEAYSRSDFAGHLDQDNLLYLDLYSGRPQLAVNDNYFRIEPPPHLQESWTGNVFGDSSIYNVSLWDNKKKKVIGKRLNGFTNQPRVQLDAQLTLSFSAPEKENLYKDLYLVNKGRSTLIIKYRDGSASLGYGDSVKLCNPWKALIIDTAMNEKTIVIEPDAFMKNFYVNGSRFYVYPLAERFIWARNFSESIASEYSGAGQTSDDALVSFDFEMMDSLSLKMQQMMNRDTAYKKGAEYGICIADGNGRLIAMADFIKGLARPDPNDKAGFNKTIIGENGYVPQSVLRKQIGNINLLRMNPGPGSTFKPIVFSAIASQLNLDWDAFAAEGFSQQQSSFGGEKVAEYDFEKNNGHIGSVVDYLRYSDNYYHSDVLLLGSYPKQGLDQLLSARFIQHNPDNELHWPWFNYKGSQYWLDGFENWPGYENGKVNFGTDSSFTSIGLLDNYGIYNHSMERSFDRFSCCYDSILFLNAVKRSGFILPEYALFDQQGANVNKRIPYDVFATCFRGHVKGSSQVLVPPTKMLDAFGKLVTQSRNYSLTLNPYALPAPFAPFVVDSTIVYNNYLSLMREGVFAGMREVLNSGTAAALGMLLKKKSTFYYYAKTGTTGDNESKTKSKLLAIVISKKDITNPDFNFRNNRFYTIYFTSQNGPAKQNEQFQNEIIEYIERSGSFNKYMSQ